MTSAFKIDRTLRERRRIIRLLDYLKRDDLTGEQMERIGRRLQKSGKRALSPLVRKLWQEKNGTAIYRYTCMLDFFDTSSWMDQLIQITLQRKDLEDDAKLALLDLLSDCGIDVTSPPFASLTGYGTSSLKDFIGKCLEDGEQGLVRFIDSFLDATDEVRERMIHRLASLNSPDAVALLEILTTFEKPEIVREAILALGRVRNGCALTVLNQAERRYEGEIADLIRRSIRRLSFVGITEPRKLPYPFIMPLPFHETQAGPIDFYGTRTLWFSWRLEDNAFAGLLILTGESDGMLNAVSYRMRDEKEYGAVIKDVTSNELLLPVNHSYALACIRDSLHRSREQGFYLPPDFYVDMRLFRPDALKPEPYIPRFSLLLLEGIVVKIPGYVATSNELLDEPGLEGWILSEPLLYDAAERLMQREEADRENGLGEDVLETEIADICEQLIVPRRGEIIKRLLLTADYLQQTACEEQTIQRTLATALSLVGGGIPEWRHPFIRRLILDSLDAARQALAEGFDLRLEEGYPDDGD